ncbi:tail tube protein [Alishewanella phage vB_AspM_Slickus01]|nr:tail tube protein [Alishewanella phage vB_AspM_Slicko01]WGH49895.1 tail tube protein [Alishewanella phage vB_AspM_Slickus01]
MANIQDIRAGGSPQRIYEFEVEILGSIAGGTLPILTQRIQTATIPETAVETFEINYKGRKTFYAGRDASGHTISLTFWNDETNSTYRFFKEWMENGISNSVVGGGLSKDLYTAQMRITQFATDSVTPTAVHFLDGIFPTNIGDITLNYDSSETQTFDVTFSFETNVLQ